MEMVEYKIILSILNSNLHTYKYLWNISSLYIEAIIGLQDVRCDTDYKYGFLSEVLPQESFSPQILFSIFHTHSLDICIELQRFEISFASNPRSLHAAERHIEITQEPTIAPNSADLNERMGAF